VSGSPHSASEVSRSLCPVRRLKYSLANPEPKKEISRDIQVPFCPMEAIGETGQLDISQTQPYAEISSGYTRFANDDVLVAKITPCFENGKGAVASGLAGGIGFGTTELHVLTPGPEVEPRFLYYVTMSSPFRRQGEAAMTGAAGQKRVPEEFVRDFRVWLPPMSVQEAIAGFLDRETAQIDTLIAEKEHLLALLAEKRAALVTRAVTQGLDPNVRRKPSCLAWLGEIPEHWKSARLKFLATVRTGLTIGKDYKARAVSDYSYLRVANVQDGYLDLSEVTKVAVPDTEAGSCLLAVGDVLMNEGGDIDKLGRGCVWKGEIAPCLHQNHVFAVRRLVSIPIGWQYGRPPHRLRPTSSSVQNGPPTWLQYPH
jgi:type I restriction enzyme S subunit